MSELWAKSCCERACCVGVQIQMESVGVFTYRHEPFPPTLKQAHSWPSHTQPLAHICSVLCSSVTHDHSGISLPTADEACRQVCRCLFQGWTCQSQKQPHYSQGFRQAAKLITVTHVLCQIALYYTPSNSFLSFVEDMMFWLISLYSACRLGTSTVTKRNTRGGWMWDFSFLNRRMKKKIKQIFKVINLFNLNTS